MGKHESVERLGTTDMGKFATHRSFFSGLHLELTKKGLGW